MVERIKTELGEILKAAPIGEADYTAKGYHLFAEVAASDLQDVARFFDEQGFYLAMIACVDYKEYLELVYIFANHASLCKVKITLKVDPAKPVAPTLSAVFDCASWYEREIREFYGVLFEGHPNMTYLFLHEGIDFYPLRKEQVPVTDEDKRALGAFKPESGEDTFSINLGPQHPSTHGVLRVVLKMDGEYIEDAQPVLGYLHRMHEKMAENRGYVQFYANTGRMDYLGAMAFNLGYVTAVERLCGIAVPERANYIRVIATELNRLQSHLMWLGAYLADLGALTPFLYVFDDREEIHDILEPVTGSRLTYAYFRFGGLYNDVDDQFVAKTRAFVERLRSRFAMYEKLVTGNVIFINRTRGIGVISQGAGAQVRPFRPGPPGRGDPDGPQEDGALRRLRCDRLRHPRGDAGRRPRHLQRPRHGDGKRAEDHRAVPGQNDRRPRHGGEGAEEAQTAEGGYLPLCRDAPRGGGDLHRERRDRHPLPDEVARPLLCQPDDLPRAGQGVPPGRRRGDPGEPGFGDTGNRSIVV